ncbi:hypothetical protein RN001_004575 [Aquatica leii]|uniref:Coiled-coil domain-containing protein 181 n=1 Tax=Aquatica leii TaxID=1421715 RepID=A0AAN7PIK6_9COLE|nr:hypothetical protein RN001_004575 [Aquatica leii]
MNTVQNDIPIEIIEEEEDCESYFLQPASSPYDIAEKLKEANENLNNEHLNYEEKQTKVKFKDNLVDYEPEFSYDDVSSIKSEDNIDYALMDHDTSILENHLATALILNVSDVEEDEDDEEVIEEISIDCSSPPCEVKDENVNFNVQCEHSNKCTNEDKLNKSVEKKIIKKKVQAKFNLFIPEGISCKRHCIDDVDRFNFNSSITKIHLFEKSYKCPRLKLQRRNCCENNELKFQQKLPHYNGLRSEYGLNALQLERRQRRNEILQLKEQERQRVIEERKQRKEQQNEKVFCEWLKEVSSRKVNQKKSVKTLPLLNRATLMFSGKETEKYKRPTTADQPIMKSIVKRRRPHTSTSCVFIEVPQNVLPMTIFINQRHYKL